MAEQVIDPEVRRIALLRGSQQRPRGLAMTIGQERASQARNERRGLCRRFGSAGELFEFPKIIPRSRVAEAATPRIVVGGFYQRAQLRTVRVSRPIEPIVQEDQQDVADV